MIFDNYTEAGRIVIALVEERDRARAERDRFAQALADLLEPGDDGNEWDHWPKRLTEEQRERLCAAWKGAWNK